ncbi:hypothetical protein [Nocardia terpenica]|uniref:Uncharacterized protein n=1 Tax=Nocardia terpenica TaxID=455432 RepID=A0A164HP27_9NOCA|nr:hypothetical protein [Nocardia terpenica]KZM68677.1 hypothetical protein AWN90_12680 [Nocardia terpenica]NQE88328.1 hypothetical protein [Nocardia terpenica]
MTGAEFQPESAAAAHTHTGSDGAVTPLPFGPILPEHATDGWELRGDSREWWLARRHGLCDMEIRATTQRSCAMRVRRDGALVREASASSVEYAKQLGQQWIYEHQPPDQGIM